MYIIIIVRSVTLKSDNGLKPTNHSPVRFQCLKDIPISDGGFFFSFFFVVVVVVVVFCCFLFLFVVLEVFLVAFVCLFAFLFCTSGSCSEMQALLKYSLRYIPGLLSSFFGSLFCSGAS